MTTNDVGTLKQKLLNKKMPEQAVNRMMAYVQGELAGVNQKFTGCHAVLTFGPATS